jgi:prolyl 4-hydroxylase
MVSKDKGCVMDALAPMRVEIERRNSLTKMGDVNSASDIEKLRTRLIFKTKMMTDEELEKKIVFFGGVPRIHKENNTAKKDRLIDLWVETEESKLRIRDTLAEKTGVSPEKITIVSARPIMFYIDEFLKPHECDHIRECAENKLKKMSPDAKRSRVAGRGRNISKRRTGNTCFIDNDSDNINKSIRRKVCDLVGKSSDNAECMSVTKYSAGDQYYPHYDGVHHNHFAHDMEFMRFGGQRVSTALMYLNEGDGLGSTEMVNIPIKVEPKKGRVFVFENVKKDTNILDRRSYHAGLPGERGDKWICNIWFREFNVNEYYKDHNPDYYRGWWTTRSVASVFGSRVAYERDQAIREKKTYNIFTPDAPRKKEY